MACKNEKKKLTFEDKWYKVYTKKAGHRQHKSDKKFNTRKMRKINEKIIQKELTNE